MNAVQAIVLVDSIVKCGKKLITSRSLISFPVVRYHNFYTLFQPPTGFLVLLLPKALASVLFIIILGIRYHLEILISSLFK